MNELIGRYRQGPELLESALQSVTADESLYSHMPGKWNIRQILRHLVDTEIVAAGRFRQIIAEDNPPINAFKQDLWASSLDYAAIPAEDSLAKLKLLRSDNADLLEHAGESVLSRAGHHAERGPVTVQQLIELFTRHVDTHKKQIEAIRAAWKEK